MEQEKLYSPINFFLRDKIAVSEGQYDDVSYWRDEITHKEALAYISEIQTALADDRQLYDNGRGLAEYLREGHLNDKVQSLAPCVELYGDQLYTVADIQLNEPLTPIEMSDLKFWWEGQLSDGWGEGFEQQVIKINRGDLYVKPWTASDDFRIFTQEQFDRHLRIDQSAETRGALLTEIAKRNCRIDTLETRNSDSLDFHDVSVWGLKAALQEAFKAGITHEMERTAGAELPTHKQSAPSKPSLLARLGGAKEKLNPSRENPPTKNTEPEL